MADIWTPRGRAKQPLDTSVFLNYANTSVRKVVGGVIPFLREDYTSNGLRGGIIGVRGTVQGVGMIGGSGRYARGSSQRGLIGRSSGGSINTHHHTVMILAHNVTANSFFYDSQSDGATAHDITTNASNNLIMNASGANIFGTTTVPIPTSGPVRLFIYSGQQNTTLPFAVVNGVTYTSSTTANQDSFSAMSYSTWFGSSAFPAANLFNGTGILALIFRGRLSNDEIASLNINPWQLFRPSLDPLFYNPKSRMFLMF